MKPGLSFKRKINLKEKVKAPDPGLFIGFFTANYFSIPTVKKEPAIDIAGLCLPLKPQKEKGRINLISESHSKIKSVLRERKQTQRRPGMNAFKAPNIILSKRST